MNKDQTISNTKGKFNTNMSFYKKLSSSSLIYILLVSFAVLALTFFIVGSNNFNLSVCTTELTATASKSERIDSHVSTTAITSPNEPKPEYRLLLAIVTLPELYERRHLIRTIFSLQTYNREIAHIDIRYVFCNLTSEEQKVLIALEIIRYDDIIIVNCKENMNDGKTYAFLSQVPTLYADAPYDFVMKADDDSYIILDKLVESLRDKPREDMYYGLKMPCDTKNFFPFPPFMEGMGYVLSWDLIEWIATSDLPRKDNIGLEDMWTGRWFNLGGKAKKRFDMAPQFYDYKGYAETNCYRHDFIPDSILVHRLKKNFQWADTLRYFNITSGLKPSKFYHIS